MNRAIYEANSAIGNPRPAEWRELTCEEYETLIHGDDGARVASSITDPDGVYGSPLIFTLWLLSDGAWLSTALEGSRETPDYKCTHVTAPAPQSQAKGEEA